MGSLEIQIQLVTVVTAAACALPGAFLILRRMAMMSDAISHTVLLGIVLAFFLVGDLTSPVLILGAAAVGVLTISLVVLLERTRLVKEDAAIGLVFPALFSLAVILISRFAGNVHLDADAVLLGEPALAPFDRMLVFGRDIGPRGFYLMGGILLINLAFITIFYKELKLSTFDAGLAATLGFAPVVLHYALMSLVSITVVGAFDVVGSVLVVALMIAPPAAAYLLTDRLARMLGLSVVMGAISAVGGYWLAYISDTSIAGSMATMSGILFGLTYLFAPQRGLIAQEQRRRRQRWDFAQTMLAIHLLNHEGLPENKMESRVTHLRDHMRWEDSFARQVVQRSIHQAWVKRVDGHLELTDIGRRQARNALVK